jgi:N-acetylmuramoyl-L-alanine amidase
MLEAGNMRDRADAARMVSDRGQHRYAAALVRAIEGFLLTR